MLKYINDQLRFIPKHLHTVRKTELNNKVKFGFPMINKLDPSGGGISLKPVLTPKAESNVKKITPRAEQNVKFKQLKTKKIDTRNNSLN